MYGCRRWRNRRLAGGVPLRRPPRTRGTRRSLRSRPRSTVYLGRGSSRTGSALRGQEEDHWMSYRPRRLLAPAGGRRRGASRKVADHEADEEADDAEDDATEGGRMLGLECGEVGLERVALIRELGHCGFLCMP